MWHDGSQNNEVYSCSFRECSRDLAEDQDPTELLDTYFFTRAGENDSKSWFIMFTHLHLFILHRRSSSFVCQFSHQFQKSEKDVHSTTLRAEKLHCPVSFDILWLYLNQCRIGSLSSTEPHCHAYRVSEHQAWRVASCEVEQVVH